VMRLAAWELNIETVERPIDRSELYMGDELFFTGTAVAITPIVRVDHRPVKDGKIGEVTRRLQQLYFDATRGHLQVYRNWLTPVYQTQAKNEPETVATAAAATV
jgi:branched-chain amino acid aminotransferase